MNTLNDILAAGFVAEGAVVVRELGLEGMMAPIPHGESAITSLCPTKDSKLYGLTRGLRSHLFVYDNSPIVEGVIWLGAVADEICGGDVFCAGNGTIFGFVSGQNSDGAKICASMFTYDPSKDFISDELTSYRGRPVTVPCPFGQRKFSRLVFDQARERIYGLFLPENVLFTYKLGDQAATEIGAIGKGPVSNVLGMTDKGVIYGVADGGRLFRLVPDAGKIEMTDLIVPSGKGKEYVNTVSAFAFDPANEYLYGGTWLDGLLFKVELQNERVICLGRPGEQRPIRCLAVGKDGKVFGIAGEPKNGIVHLFRYNPRTGDLRDLGILRSTITMTWVAHEIDAMCTNRNGHIVMGENDRMSHLIIYYPAVDGQ